MSTQYAGFWLRGAAHIIDSVILNAVGWLVETALLQAFFWAVPGAEPKDNSLWLQVFSAGIYLVIAFPYFVWGHFRWGTTLGKRPFRIYVVQAGSLEPITVQQSILRFCAYLLSYLTLFAGFIMAAFQPEKRALHDLVAGTVSIRRDPVPAE